MKKRLLASIDIGTNTFRLLIAKVHHNPESGNFTIDEIFSQRIITRLGDGIQANNLLDKEAVERSIKTLKEFSTRISEYNVERASVIATSALREAKNSEMFIKEVRERTGLNIVIITGKQEARLTAAGMLIDMAAPESAIMTDIGGGSTEIIYSEHGEPLFVNSQNLGVVYLANKYMKHDPPSHNELNLMSKEITDNLQTSYEEFFNWINHKTVLIGTAGTITALAAMTRGLMKFDHSIIHKCKMSLEKIKEVYSLISSLSISERARLIPFEPSRLDIIVPGTLILLKLMDLFQFREITVSNYGLREGILIDLYKKSDI